MASAWECGTTELLPTASVWTCYIKGCYEEWGPCIMGWWCSDTHTHSLSYAEDSPFSCVLSTGLTVLTALFLLLMRSSDPIANHDYNKYCYHLGHTKRPNKKKKGENMQSSRVCASDDFWYSLYFFYVYRRLRSNIICPWTICYLNLFICSLLCWTYVSSSQF